MLCGMFQNAEKAQLILILYQDDKGKYLSHFKRGFVVGARMAGAPLTRSPTVKGSGGPDML